MIFINFNINSKALKIHVSEATKEILDTFGTFRLELRGEIDLKGKGIVTTYFLVGCTEPDPRLFIYHIQWWFFCWIIYSFQTTNSHEILRWQWSSISNFISRYNHQINVPCQNYCIFWCLINMNPNLEYQLYIFLILIMKQKLLMF